LEPAQDRVQWLSLVLVKNMLIDSIKGKEFLDYELFKRDQLYGTG
jgi:hypothetical protein